MSSPPDHFALFGLAPRFGVDLTALETAYKDVQARVHPDRFAAGTAAERRVAMQWATRANEAFRSLRDDARRAAYLCEMNGVSIDAESNTAMPPAFLMQQMTWRETLDEAVAVDIATLKSEVEAVRKATVGEIAEAADAQRDFARVASLVRQLMFIDKFLAEVASREALVATGG